MDAGSRRAMIGARVALAHVHRERDELDRAVEVLAPHIDAALLEGHVAICTLGEVELARIEYAQGAADDAIARLLRVRRDRAARGTPRFLSALLDVAECRLRLQIGDVDRAADLLADIAAGPERTLLAARAELAAGRPEEVPELLSELLAAPDDRRRWFEAAALAARAAAEAGDLAGRGGRSARSPLPPSGRVRCARSSKRASTCSTRPRCWRWPRPRGPTGTSGWSSR